MCPASGPGGARGAGPGATSPTTRVLTSAHSPPRKGTMAPSALTTARSGPWGTAGNASSSQSTAASCTAAAARPTTSVSRRAVAALTRTCVKRSSSWEAGSKGIHVPSCANCSCNWGVSAPGNSASSSSRGEKALPTLWADAVLALQGQLAAPLGLQPPRLAPTSLQRRPALATPWRLSGLLLFRRLAPPGRRRALLGQVGEQPCPVLGQPPVQLVLDLLQCRARMLRAPILHPPEHVLA